MTLGERIRNLREERNMTVTELADLVGVTKQAVSQIEKEINSPRPKVLACIADALDCTTDYLLGREGHGTGK